jgi:3-dehydroquinate dehydratase-1
MARLGNVVLDGVTKIVIAITDQDQNNAIQSSCADILEARVDEFRDQSLPHVQEQIKRLGETGSPIILTVRNDAREGGRGSITDDYKQGIFESAISFVDAVDIELSSPIAVNVIKLARDHAKTVIVSSHNFKETVSNDSLEDLFQRSSAVGADIVKIAMQANIKDDVRRLMAFTLKHKADNVVTMSLGGIGSVSRLTLPAMGSLLTYSYLSKESAPGQIQLFRLQDDLRFYYPDYNEYFIGRHSILEHA